MRQDSVCHLLLGAANEVAGIQKYLTLIWRPGDLLVINKASRYEKYLNAKQIKYVVYVNLKQLQKILQKKNIKIIHGHLGQTLWPMWLLAFKLKGLKLVYTQHFIDPAHTNDFKKHAKKFLVRLFFSRVDKVIAISNAVKEGILRRKEVPASKIELIYNGINLPTKKTEKIPDKKVVTICRMEKEKRPQQIIELAKLMPDYQFTVVGGGTFLAALKKQNIKNINWLGYQKNVGQYLQKASFFFFPAQREPFGLVVVEALAQGLPVIATGGGALPEVISSNEGLLVKNNNLLEAKQFIEKLTKNKNLYRQYSANCLAKAAKFSITKMQTTLFKLYERL